VAEAPQTFLAAALAVLRGSSRPLTAREITQEATRRGLLKTSGKTPDASMAAALYLHVRDSQPPQILRISEPGPNRARRGSVRWTLSER
jgi:hypothetical protein